jgi:hypothetical protein
MPADGHNARSKHDPRIVAELDYVLTCVCDGEATEDQRRRLNQILDQDYEARRYYLRYISIHSALFATAGSCAQTHENEVSRAISPLSVDDCEAPEPAASLRGNSQSRATRGADTRRTIRWVASVAALLCIAASAVLWTKRVGRPVDETVLANVDHSGRSPRNAPDPNQLPAVVTYVSDTASWLNANESYALASQVQSGQRLTLECGQVELTYSSGAKLLLTGPSEFLVLESGGNLLRGELVARVPEAGRGFAVTTPHGKVVDLGTEFGVVVDDFGVSQVSVFEGKVDTFPNVSTSASGNKIQLTKGSALQWTSDSIIPTSVRGRRYHHPSNDRSAERSSIVEPTANIDENFVGADLLPPQRWRVNGDVAPTEHGLVFGSVVGNRQRPYLVTVPEFDPSQGAVTITCDLRFADVLDPNSVSFAILTRGTDKPSKPGAVWQDMLARCVRCNLRADPGSGEGRLEAGTKYEADREPTSISWGGFARPKADTLYHLEMRDDGLNVSFTVSLAENPSVRKTITCRSLFRDNRNVVAFEGSDSATAIVERLHIAQDTSPNADRDELASSRSIPSKEQSAGEYEALRQLDALAPETDTLVLKDDFDGNELNSEIWSSLGDVVLRDGQIQLGVPNAEQHIDTWRARPYLLTTQQFEPAARRLTILGKATFAENFLQGYGGSFAVMTRANDERGEGPGWENSILRRGLRSNFWPAAFGFDHSLEIHEKPTANTISLLAADALQISPESRSYLFRVVDDGHSVTLTIVDASNPKMRKTISHSTLPRDLTSGYVGFESCWGSPVLLDDVRVYEGQRN